MIALEEVVVVGGGIVHMGDHQVLLIVGDQVLIMAEPAAQFMNGTMGQCMTGAEVLIMGGTGVQCMTSAEVLSMGGIGVLSMIDTAGMLSLISNLVLSLFAYYVLIYSFSYTSYNLFLFFCLESPYNSRSPVRRSRT